MKVHAARSRRVSTSMHACRQADAADCQWFLRGRAAVHSCCCCPGGLCWPHLHDVVVQVDAALVAPLVHPLAHGGRGGDGVDEGNVGKGVRHVCGGLIAIDGLHDGLAGALAGRWGSARLHGRNGALAVLLELRADIPGCGLLPVEVGTTAGPPTALFSTQLGSASQAARRWAGTMTPC